MQPMSSSALDIPASHSKTNRSTSQRQTVDSSHAHVEDKNAFKETLEKSKASQKASKLTEEKSQEKTEKNILGNNSPDIPDKNESSFASNQTVLEPLIVDESSTAIGLNLSVLNDNSLSHATAEDVSWLSNQAFSLGDSLAEGKAITTENENNITALESSDFGLSLILPDAITQATQATQGIGDGSSNALAIAQNISTVTGSVVQSSSEITKTPYILNTQQQSLSQENGMLSYGFIAADSKMIAAQSGNHEPNQNAMLTHNKIGLQLNTLLSKGQVDGGALETPLNPDVTVELSEPEIKAQILNAAERAEQRGAIASADKVVVSAHVKVGMPGWADQIAERTASLVSQNIKQAEIQLNPQDMGVINVKISVNQEQVAVTFTAQNAGVREALDQSVQRLRDTLEAEGMDLVQADVGGQSAQSDDSANDHESGRASHLPEGEGELRNVFVDIPSSGIDQFA